jgi:hypothetical protein
MCMELQAAIEEIQRNAAGWPTDTLRAYIHGSLDVLADKLAAMDIAQWFTGSAGADDDGCVTCGVLFAALVTALYVRELIHRPAEPPAWAGFSVN